MVHGGRGIWWWALDKGHGTFFTDTPDALSTLAGMPLPSPLSTCTS